MRFLVVCLAALISVSCVYGAAAPRHHKRAPARRVEYGKASWYGARSQGREMACGRPFNEHALIAANRTLPLGTRVRVTNLRNGRSVVVRIMDRGPWVAGRIIDLSRAAAERLGFVHRGLAPVKIRVVSRPACDLDGADPAHVRLQQSARKSDRR